MTGAPEHWDVRPILKGERHSKLTARARELLAMAHRPAETTALLQCVNTASCQPPLSDAEVDAIVRELTPEDVTRARKPRFRVWTLEELETQPDQEWLIEGMLPTECIGAVYGGTGSGKTFLALDAAMTVAGGGGEFLGRRACGGSVVYVSLEGRLKERVQARRAVHPDVAPRFVCVPDAFHLMSPVDVQDLILDIEVVAGNRLALLVLDTWRRATPGADENDSGDFSRGHDQLDIIRRHFGCSILIVHHVGGNPEKSDTPRGSSAFLAAMDFAWLVVRKGQDRKIRCAKMRDAEEFAPIGFRLRAVAPSCVVEPADLVDDDELDGNEERALAALAGRKTAVSATFWKGESKLAERTFYRVVDKLLDRGFIRRDSGGYIATGTAKALP